MRRRSVLTLLVGGLSVACGARDGFLDPLEEGLDTGSLGLAGQDRKV